MPVWPELLVPSLLVGIDTDVSIVLRVLTGHLLMLPSCPDRETQKLEVDCWKLIVGRWKLEVGSWKLKDFPWGVRPLTPQPPKSRHLPGRTAIKHLFSRFEHFHAPACYSNVKPFSGVIPDGRGVHTHDLQNPTLAAFYHFGASSKALLAWSLTFEQRQIEGQPWWQNWSILYVLQLCCWVEDLKTNSLGSRQAYMKM